MKASGGAVRGAQACAPMRGREAEALKAKFRVVVRRRRFCGCGVLAAGISGGLPGAWCVFVGALIVG